MYAYLKSGEWSHGVRAYSSSYPSISYRSYILLIMNVKLAKQEIQIKFSHNKYVRVSGAEFVSQQTRQRCDNVATTLGKSCGNVGSQRCDNVIL